MSNNGWDGSGASESPYEGSSYGADGAGPWTSGNTPPNGSPSTGWGAPPPTSGGWGTPPPTSEGWGAPPPTTGGWGSIPSGEPEGESYGAHTGPMGVDYSGIDGRPGIIPLRPLGFGEFFDGAFRAIQHNPRVMFGLSLAVAVGTAIIELLISGVWFDSLRGADMADEQVVFGVLGSVLLQTLVAAALTGLATIVLNGMLIVSVSQSVIGRKTSLATVWNQTKGSILKLIGLTIAIFLIMLAAALGTALVLGVVTTGLAFTSSNNTANALLVILLFLLTIAGAVLIGLVYVRVSLSSAALVMEGASIGRSLGRSWDLTKGFWLRNVGVLLLASLIGAAIMGLAGVPIGFLSTAIINVNTNLVMLSFAVSSFLSSILSAIFTPFFAAITSLLYVDLRMRKEGLDVELIRAAGTPG